MATVIRIPVAWTLAAMVFLKYMVPSDPVYCMTLETEELIHALELRSIHVPEVF